MVAPDRARQGADRILGQAESLAHLAKGGTGAIGDDGGGDGGIVAAVMIENILDHLLAPLMLEIDVDIGRLAPVGRDEALEEKAGSLRGDFGDADDIADERIGRRAAPLAQNAARAGELDDMMDGEEIGLVFERADDRELMLDRLRHRLRHAAGIAPARAVLRETAQSLLRRAVEPQGLVGIFVFQALEVEGELREEAARRLDRLRIGAQEPGHLLGRFQMALGMDGEAMAGLAQGHMLANGGHDIQEAPAGGCMVESVVGRQKRRAAGPCQTIGPGEPSLVETVVTGRDGEMDVTWKGGAKRVERAAERFKMIRVLGLEGPQPVGRQKREIEPFAPVQKVASLQKAGALFGPQVPQAQEPAEPTPARPVARIGEDVGRFVGKDEARAGGEGKARFLRRLIGAHDPRHRIAVGKAEPFKAEAFGRDDQFLGLGGAAQKGKGAGNADLGKARRFGPVGGKGHVTLLRSGEEAMHEPDGGMAGQDEVRIEAVPISRQAAMLAKEPEMTAGLVLHAKIVARGLRVLAPPFAGNALRPFGSAHPVERTAPAEGEGRSVGQVETRLDRFGLGKKPQRAQGRSWARVDRGRGLPGHQATSPRDRARCQATSVA